MVATCTATVEGAAETTQVGCQIQSPVTGDAGNAPNVILDGPTAVTAVAVTGRPLTAYTITVGGQYTLAPFNAAGGASRRPSTNCSSHRRTGAAQIAAPVLALAARRSTRTTEVWTTDPRTGVRSTPDFTQYELLPIVAGRRISLTEDRSH